MVAYAAVLSLQQNLDSILHPATGGRWVSHNRVQLKSLHEKVSVLLDFLEDYASRFVKSNDPEFDCLDTMIRNAAHHAEDIIECDISNQLLAETETVSFRIFPRFPIVYLFILVLNRKLLYVAFQKIITLWIQIFLPVMCAVPISVKSLLPTSYQNVIFVMAWVLIPLLVHIFVPFLILSVMAAGAGYVAHTTFLKWISLVARYFRFVFHPESQDLRCAIDNISFIVKEVIKIKDACDSVQSADPADGLSRQDLAGIGKNIVVGLDGELNEIHARLIGNSSELEIVPIVGMGGIGKTTLARQVHAYFIYHFDIRAWVSVSQEYSLRRVMLDLLDSARVHTEEIVKNHNEYDGDLDVKLGEHLYKNLMSRKYLIVMDDVWDTNIWDFLRRFFPENYNGSRVLLTTRQSEVASYANPCSPYLNMRLMNGNDSWHLLCEKALGGEACPPELEAIGRMISQDCRGLPLAIVVVGGVLYNEHRTVQDWTRVSQKTHSILGKDDAQCSKILGLSYNHLPHRLKPCFLYMGAFPEHKEIRVSRLFNLWAAEGFLEPRNSKSLEEVAEEYLEDLIQRSLIMVDKWSCDGKIKTCKVHHLLREVCLLNAERENFLDFANRDREISHGGVENRRRLSTHVLALLKASDDSRSSYSMTRSFICFGRNTHTLPHFYLGFRLLRVLDMLTTTSYTFPDEITKLVHLRYLGLTNIWPLPRSISRLQNLQTIVYYARALNRACRIPEEIWSMPNLRYLYFMTKTLLPDPPSCYLLRNSTVLANLQTLVGVFEFRCTKGILRSIQNLKKLSISYHRRGCLIDWSEYQLDSLVKLRQLETLKISMKFGMSTSSVSKLAFPQKLKVLSLSGCRIPWGSMRIVGALPNLQVLKLRNFACYDEVWEPVEGEFCQLMFLLLEDSDLEQWRSNEIHFPRLQRLILRRCNKLLEVPSGIGEIPTLERMELVDCHPSAVASATQILEEQQNMGNEYLKIHIEDTYFDPQM